MLAYMKAQVDVFFLSLKRCISKYSIETYVIS
jgi:hypothetical protein